MCAYAENTMLSLGERLLLFADALYRRFVNHVPALFVSLKRPLYLVSSFSSSASYVQFVVADRGGTLSLFFCCTKWFFANSAQQGVTRVPGAKNAHGVELFSVGY